MKDSLGNELAPGDFVAIHLQLNGNHLSTVAVVVDDKVDPHTYKNQHEYVNLKIYDPQKRYPASHVKPVACNRIIKTSREFVPEAAQSAFRKWLNQYQDLIKSLAVV